MKGRLIVAGFLVALGTPFAAFGDVIKEQPVFSGVEHIGGDVPLVFSGASQRTPSLLSLFSATGTVRTAKIRYDMTAWSNPNGLQLYLYECPLKPGDSLPQCRKIVARDAALAWDGTLIHPPVANTGEMTIDFNSAQAIGFGDHEFTDGVPLNPDRGYRLEGVFDPNSHTIDVYGMPGETGGFFPYFKLEGDVPTSTPATSTPPTCTENCNSNVMFLPGIQGTRLYAPGVPFEDQLWEPNNEGDIQDLFLDSEGESIRDDVYVKESGVIDDIPVTGSNIYKSFLNDLEEWKTTENLIGDYRVVAYDWRLSIDDILTYGRQDGDKIYYSGSNRATSTPYILQELRRLAATSRNGKVTIVAHSNGGLVAKALLQQLEATSDPLLDAVDKLILIAVPQTGTVQAIGAALHGYDIALPADWLPLLLDPQTGRAFVGTSPMMYHLLPSSGYQSGDGSTVGTPTVTFDVSEKTTAFNAAYGTTIDNSSELKNFLSGSEGRPQPDFDDVKNPSRLSPALLQYAESVHSNIDTWIPPASMQVHEIAGWGIPTLGSIRYWTGKECIERTLLGTCTRKVPKLLYTPQVVIDGDGVVVTPSALAIPTNNNVSRSWLNLEVLNQPVLSADRDHPDLLEVGSLRDFVSNTISGTSNTLPEFMYSAQPLSDGETRLEFVLHSPLSLSVTDGMGHHVNASVSDIPGAVYRRFGEVQYISIPKSTHPTLNLLGFANGSYTLEIREVSENSTVASTIFTGLPSSTSTHVVMNFPDGSIENATELQVDYDGNGDIDSSFRPVLGGVVEPETDVISPEAILIVSTSTRTLHISGIDDVSSTTVVTVGDSTTIRDGSGNETVLKFRNTFTNGYLSSSRLLSIRYGTSTVVSLPTSFVYIWNSKTNPATLVSQTVIVDKQFVIEALYNVKRNRTTIVVLKRNIPIQIKTVPGQVLVKLTTQDGMVTYSW
ncbi:MAG: hypothetical protein KBD06_00860 [Candidatus Pacebacteria bacterium]|nr:hypothetical protein [Candidatus Paceibacterota bacterium]